MSWYGLTQKPLRFPLIQIVDTSIPPATVGQAYTYHLTVVNSSGVLSFQVTGSTGNWLSCNSSGFLFGTPSVADTESITVTVTDATGAVSAPSNFTLTVNTGSSIDFNGLFLGNSFQNIVINPAQAQTFGAFIQFQGTDTKYLNTLPRYPASPWGGTANVPDAEQQLFNVPGDITETIITDNTVPTGVSTKVLQSLFVNAYTPAKSTQDTYQIQPAGTVATQGMLYTSRWLFLQNNTPTDLLNRTLMGGGAGSFLMFCEFKNADPAERFGTQLRLQNFPGYGNVPCFELYHDDTSVANDAFYLQTEIAPTQALLNAASPNQTIGQTYPAPVPLGRWFRWEQAFNRNDAQGQGWMWVALTDPGSTDVNLQAGIQIFAARGAFNHNDRGTTYTLGMNMVQPTKPINRLYLHTAYSDITRSAGSTYAIKMTDMQVYTRWPSTATAHPANYL